MLVLLLHDWVPLPPLNDISALNEEHSLLNRIITTLINTSISIAAIVLTYTAIVNKNLSASIGVLSIYSLLTIGAFFAWWKPYFFGCSDKHKLGLKQYENTHHFLPKRNENPTPNTLHVIIHILIIACLGYSINLLTQM